MKKLLFGIFAHPDDEAFGPAAYIYSQAQAGVDVHLLLVTDGEAGTNEGYDNLAKIRLNEWLESGKRIGAKSNFALHYPDGGLCNNLYHEISDKVIARIKDVIADYREQLEVHFITYEERGISGHLDHIAVSYMTTYIYEKLRRNPMQGVTIGILKYYCLPRSLAETCNCDWLNMPAGRHSSEIDDEVSFKEIADVKMHIMDAHISQKNDRDYIVSRNLAADYWSDNFIHYKE